MVHYALTVNAAAFDGEIPETAVYNLCDLTASIMAFLSNIVLFIIILTWNFINTRKHELNNAEVYIATCAAT